MELKSLTKKKKKEKKKARATFEKGQSIYDINLKYSDKIIINIYAIEDF
jgi:hypothetical protein